MKMYLKLLNKSELARLYEAYMKADFPPDELKPLAMIFDGMDRGIYESYGLVQDRNVTDEGTQNDGQCRIDGPCSEDGQPILGYTCLVKIGEDYLVDYLAICPEYRNSGYGGILLKLLREQLNQAESIILEVENPDFAENSEERQLRIRRMDFYKRNGFFDTGVKATCFGVPFIIMETGKAHPTEQIATLFRAHYKIILPAELYEKHVVVKAVPH